MGWELSQDGKKSHFLNYRLLRIVILILWARLFSSLPRRDEISPNFLEHNGRIEVFFVQRDLTLESAAPSKEEIWCSQTMTF